MLEAVIMAGGEGARLRPVTSNLPKPMAPVANRPIMHHIVDLLRRQGVTRAYATLHYLADEIESYFGDGAEFGLPIRYVVEDVPLGTAGSVKRVMAIAKESEADGAPPLLTETFIVISGDALTDIDLRPALEFHRRRGAIATLVLARVPDPLEYGVVIIDGEGTIARFLEKPSPGEVFSDTVNTGIYLLEPEAMASVPAERPYDFSRDLFPALLADGKLLCGYVAEGYWTDIGGLEQYRQANQDCLEGRVAVELPGACVDPGVVVGENTRVHPEAEIIAPVAIGHGCSISAGARIGPLTVIGDNCVVEEGAQLERSVIWSGTFIGQGARIQAATICRNVVIKRLTTVNEGAVVGDRCQLEEGTTVMPHIRMWPYKFTERGSKVTMSLIWGTKWPGTLFGAMGVTGLANIEIIPEFAAKLGAAFGAFLDAGSQVITSRDSHHASRMTKRAMISGLMSVGASVLDLRIMPGAVSRHMANISGAAAGVHIAASPSEHGELLIEFFDGTGKNLDRNAERRIEQIFFREDFRRAPVDSVGSLEFLGRTMEYYTEDFLSFLDARAIGRWRPKLVIDYAYGPLCLLMPMVLGRLGCDATALNAFVEPSRSEGIWARREERLTEVGDVVRALKADIGLFMGSHGDRFAAVDELGVPLVGDDLLLAFLELALELAGEGARVAVPFSATAGVEEVCTRHGASVIRTKADARSLMETAGHTPDLAFAGDSDGGFIFPRFLPAFDAMLAAGKLLELLAGAGLKLSDIRVRTPRLHRARTVAPCPWEHKGAIMRRLHEETTMFPVEHLDGMKIHHENGWALVLPDVSAPLFHVQAESTDSASAEQLVRHYATRIEELQQGL